jgi:exodeoxyribonuclease VII large subunit
MESSNTIIDKTAEKKVFSLYQLNKSIRNTLETKTGNARFWVKAEIAKISISRPGHAYLDLVEEVNGIQQAAIKGNIWRNSFDKINKELGESAESVLKVGSEIVFKCQVSFHEVHGLSLVIEAIDLSFMLGELERRKAEAILKIKSEGIHLLNSSLQLPTVIQKVALVGSPGTSGFRDFVKHVVDNEWLYKYEITVYATSVQGVNAPNQISKAVLQADLEFPDVIVILRGGGSPLDLDCFNDYNLALTISKLKSPVLTGIGHETDFCLADLVSNRYFKTPTDVGDFIVDRTNEFSFLLVDIATRIGSRSKTVLFREHTNLNGAKIILRDIPIRIMNSNQLLLNTLRQDLNRELIRILDRKKEILQNLASTMELLKPSRTLARGFSIVRHNDKAISNALEVQKGDNIDIEFHMGSIKAEVKIINQKTNHGENK